ncbi:Rft protein-domain-containing protein [Globomyces pollinis-pini]|nr:Rft protein-domain-containing protein [Globomyces pollinis-pini]
MSNLAKSLHGTGLILSQQLITRMATFLSNIVLTRISNLKMIGILQDLDLFHSSLLFLSREAIRMGLLRNSSKSQHLQFLINMAYLPILVFFVLITLSVLIGNSFINEDKVNAYTLYAIAAGLELMTEPLYIYCQNQLLYTIRVSAEGFAFLLQVGFTLVLALYSLNENGLLEIDTGIEIYAYSQILFSIVLFLTYAFLLKRSSASFSFQKLFPKCIENDLKDHKTYIWFDPYLVSVSLSFVIQTIVKHLLTVGDKLVLVSLGIGDAQKGGYRLVTDLGSLVARILFQPIEETSRAFFSKSLTNHDGEEIAINQISESLQMLQTLFKFHIIFGAFFVCFGSNYTSVLLKYLYSKTDNESVNLLSIYCVYVPFMGINGISEAFFQGVGNPKALAKQTVYMVFFWATFIGFSYVLMEVFALGSQGLIIANVLNMSQRILFCSVFIIEFFKSCMKNQQEKSQTFTITGFFPGTKSVWIFFIMSWLITNKTKEFGLVYHLSIGITCGLIEVYLMYFLYGFH